MDEDRFNDPVGAFCRDNHVALAGADAGPLFGLRFGVKDVFHIAGHKTGFGHPEWLRTHEQATVTATAVQSLLDAGARMVGKTHSDELTYSLTGENVHYGTPVNVRAPDRIPGGSSNGSAAAVAAGLVDFALGTDCGGSVRLPASYCGILGLRPTHGRVPLDGVIPFAPSFDVVGCFADDLDVLEKVARVLLNDSTEPTWPRRLLQVNDAFAMVEATVADALKPAVARVADAIGVQEDVTLSPEGLWAWMEVFRVVQGSEIWANHGDWVRKVKPVFGPGIRERLEWASTLDATIVASCRAKHEAIRTHISDVIGEGDMLCLPTSPRVAPPRNTPSDDIEIRFRHQALCLLCIAGLGGLPQLSLPLVTLDGLPLGLSLVGPRGSDLQLLKLAAELMPPAN